MIKSVRYDCRREKGITVSTRAILVKVCGVIVGIDIKDCRKHEFGYKKQALRAKPKSSSLTSREF